MNVKPGDLAFLRGLVEHPQYNGRVVEVRVWDAFRGCWLVEPQWPLDADLQPFGIFGAEDSHLIPITPPAPEQLRIEDTFDPMLVALGIPSKSWSIA